MTVPDVRSSCILLGSAYLVAAILVLPNRMDPFWQQRVMHVLTAGMWYAFS